MKLQSEINKLSRRIEFNKKKKAKYLSELDIIEKRYEKVKAAYTKRLRKYGERYRKLYKKKWVAFRTLTEKHRAEREDYIERLNTNISAWNSYNFV